VAEDTLSESERSAILGQVFAKKEEAPKVAESKAPAAPKDPGSLSFGELMEQTLQIRQGLDAEDKQDENKINEARQRAISASRMDILKDMKL
jgi:hypothetical protein